MHPHHSFFGCRSSLNAFHFFVMLSALATCGLLVGCGVDVPTPISISPSGTSVRVGATLALHAEQLGATVTGGVWSVVGGLTDGSIDANGLYTAPASVPATAVTVIYQAMGQTATTTIQVLNPIPAITQVSPATIIQLSTPVILSGNGFVSGSAVLVGGVAVPTTFVDSSHLSATLLVPSVSTNSLTLSVSNPAPGPIVGSALSVPVDIAPVTVSPQSASVRLGSTLTLDGMQLGVRLSGGMWSVTGGAVNGSITPTGVYSPPPMIPLSNINIVYQAMGQTATSTLSIVNPVPTISQFVPAKLIQMSSPIVVDGTGFVAGSQILVNGAAVSTTFVDGSHLSATLLVPSQSTNSMAVAVSNPNPGAAVSIADDLPVAIEPLTISPPSPSVRLGTSQALAGMQEGAPVSGGVWTVVGGAVNGTIGPDGIYSAPAVISAPTTTVSYAALHQTAYSTVTLLNPLPTVAQTSPSTLTEMNTAATVIGAGFVRGSQVRAGGFAINTTYVDSQHLTATIPISSAGATSLALTVSNPNPGSAVSNVLTVPVKIAPLTIFPAGASVRIGSTLALSAEQLGTPVAGGTWSIAGGTANGSIDSNGIYTPPAFIPPTSVTVTYKAIGQIALATVQVLNPTPTVTQVTPETLVNVSNPVVLTGNGFVSGAQVLVGGVAVSTTFVDASHLSATVLVPNTTTASLTLAVSNPGPGAIVGGSLSVPVDIAPVTFSPSALNGGNVTITATIDGLPTDAVMSLNGSPLTVTSIGANSIAATGYLPYWKTGSASVAILPGNGSVPLVQVDIPIAATAVSYDVAARFAMQAGFGPRHDIIEHIQQIGLSAFIDEQLSVPPDTYPNIGYGPLRAYMLNVVQNNTQLRLRMAWAFQSFIPEQGIFCQPSTLPWEQTLEADAFTNFRQILEDAASDPNVTTLLNLPGNTASSDPNVHPNQNFARELLQLFSIGQLLLNDDGTLQTDATGNPVPAYDQDTILDLSRALTGWYYAPPVNPAFTFYGIDYTQKLVPEEWRHDKGAKTIFGTTMLPAGQTTTEDRKQVLDAVFQHPNVPPFVSRRLIQRFVKSQPSPSYIARISAVFKDDGNGVRGNLSAVLKAILLDPEARAGDSTPTDDDGYVQDPLFAELFAMELMDIGSTDGSAEYYPSALGEPIWYPTTVFAYYSPDYVIPGTTLNSPESQLITTALMVQRSEFLWGMINGPQTGFHPWGSSWLSTTFPTVPTLIDALNHIAYHGTMSSFQQDAIASYCGSLSDLQSQLRCTLLLAVNGDAYTVVH